MSEENTTETTETATESTPAATKAEAATNLLVTIAERIKASAPEVAQRYVDAEVEKAITERVGLLDKVMQKRFQLLGELKKIDRPDEVKKDATGKVIFEAWSDARREEVKKAKEQLGKVEKALEFALTNNDWSKVKELK